jgi:anaerobic magnesium-protoporphyrin IX monomethyl ester cyclase
MKCLLINCPDAQDVYVESKIRLGVSLMPPLSLASLAAVLIQENHEVKVIDLRLSNYPFEDLKEIINKFSPDYAGITFTTPLFKTASKIMAYIKEIKKDTICMAGGPHASALPQETITEPAFDIVVIGEGELTINEILANKNLNEINGIIYRENQTIKRNEPRALIENLDTLPYPAWHLFDIKKYKTPRLSCRKNPVGPMETSRGCVYGCVYCSKCIFGRRFRKKSVARIVDEMEFMLKSGFKEIHMMDDMFSTNLEEAKQVCDEIIKRKLKFPWNLTNGIRVDRVDEEILTKLKNAGCYRVSFGVESGDDNVLKLINKDINTDQIRNAFKLANKVGIETVAFCMFGLPGETKESMQKTIDLINEIKPTLPKLSILLPLPNTPLFEEWDKEGLILTKNWDDYSFHSSKRVYKHPTLTEVEIYEYYKKFWRDTLLSPSFVFRRIIRDLKTGELIYDIYYFLKTLKFGW